MFFIFNIYRKSHEELRNCFWRAASPRKKKQVSFHNNLTLNLKTPFYIQPKKVYVARERKRKQIYREYEKYYY